MKEGANHYDDQCSIVLTTKKVLTKESVKKGIRQSRLQEEKKMWSKNF